MKSIFKMAAAVAAASMTLACAPDKTAEAREVIPPAAAASLGTQASDAAVAMRFVTLPTGNSARYRIREQLVGLDLPNDAIGETAAVTGVIAVDAKGKIIPSESKFTVDVTALKSDKDRRDGFVRRRVLETEQYPSVTFVPTGISGVSLPLPKSGTRTLDVTGDLTVRGNTRPTTWKVNARFDPSHVAGSATTSFTFADFAIAQPKVPVVLSVGDTIRLELDFSMVPEAVKR